MENGPLETILTIPIDEEHQLRLSGAAAVSRPDDIKSYPTTWGYLRTSLEKKVGDINGVPVLAVQTNSFETNSDNELAVRVWVVLLTQRMWEKAERIMETGVNNYVDTDGKNWGGCDVPENLKHRVNSSLRRINLNSSGE